MMNRVELAKWVSMLARLVEPRDPEGAAKAIMGMAPMLDDIDPKILDLKLLQEVAAACTHGMPNYAKLRGFMDARMDALKPKLTSNSVNNREAAERAKASESYRATVEDWSDPMKVLSSARNLDGHPQRRRMGRLLSALVQRHAPGNLQYLPPEFLEG